MKTTGEFQKLNLIPVKKAVVDPHKGIIMRTYYVNPHKYMQTTLRTKLEKSYVYLTRLNDNIDKAIKNNNIHLLKNEFKSNNDWNVLVNRRIDYNNIEHKPPKNDLQLYFTNLVNYISTLDNSYLTKSKKLYKNANRNNYKVNISSKIKKQKKIKIKVKEQTTNIINFQDIINEYDNAFIQHKIEITSEYNPIQTGLNISKVLNSLNPATPKYINILLNISEKTLQDKYYITRNIYILPYHTIAEKDFFKSFLTTMIYNTETEKEDNKFKYIDNKVLYYNYFLLSIIDNNTFKDLVNEFNRNDIILYIKNDFNSILLNDKDFSFFIKLIFYPDLNKLINEILSNYENYDLIKKYNILCSLSARYDVTPDIFKKIFYLLDFKIDIEKSLNNFDRYVRGINIYNNENILFIEDLILQIIIGKISKIIYFPYNFYDNIMPLNNPFCLTPIVKISTLINDIIPIIKKYIRELPTIKKESELYIPLIDINSQLNNIAYQLLPLQIAYKNINDIEYSYNKNLDFVKVYVNEYKKFKDNIYLITPYNLINNENIKIEKNSNENIFDELNNKIYKFIENIS